MKDLKIKNIVIGILLIVLVICIILLILEKQKENKIASNNIKPSIDNVIMKIKDGTLTKTGATVIITDNNVNPYTYGIWFRIDKKIDDEWQELEPIGTDIGIFTEVAYVVGKNKKLELEQDWSKYYGTLETGEYRLVKQQYEDGGYKYFWVEFSIND